MIEIHTCHLDLAFLHDYASNKQRILGEDERSALEQAQTAFNIADEIFISLGGRAGRLGECIVATALLDATLQALRYLGKQTVPIHVFVDAGVRELFKEQPYRKHYGQPLHFSFTSEPDTIDGTISQLASGQHVLFLDFHGAHDGMPSLLIQQEANHDIAKFASLFRVGVRSYAQRTPERRYADCIEDLFSLPVGSINGVEAQPRLLLADKDTARYPRLLQDMDLDAEAVQVVCFFQSVVLAKCYEHWDTVMQQLCEYFATQYPARKLEFLVACGPDEEDIPPSVTHAALEDEYKDFHGVNGNACVLVRTTPSLRDLAILLSNATVVLSNDTGPGHMAGALGTHTITPYMPGNVY